MHAFVQVLIHMYSRRFIATYNLWILNCVASTLMQTDLVAKESALVQQNRKTSEELERSREILDQVREESKLVQKERNSIEVTTCIV